MPNSATEPATRGRSPVIARTSVDLPGAVGAHERHELTLVHGEIDAAQHRATAEGDRDVADRDDLGSVSGQHPFAVCSAARLALIRER